MRNDTRSKKLTLVDSSGHPINRPSDFDDYGAEYVSEDGSQETGTVLPNEAKSQQTLLGFAIVSVSCAVAAVAAGSYAIWLSRRATARDAISDVQDILQSCQNRMKQLENELGQLPNRG